MATCFTSCRGFSGKSCSMSTTLRIFAGKQMRELIRLVRERNARLILSGDTRQHGAVEASDALLAIERHAGVKPVELHKIRRQDPARGQTSDEREHIKQYRQAVKLAASGKLHRAVSQID